VADLVGDRRGLARRRRVAAGAVLVVAALAAGAVLLAWRQYDDGKQHALNEAHARVVLTATVFDTYFAGEFGTLESIAKSPPVEARNLPEMAAYFKSVQPPAGRLFTGGLGWIDRQGISRVSTTPTKGAPVDVADRGYFQRVVTTLEPYVSNGLVTKSRQQRVVVMAVPTFDTQGALTGVLAGALNLEGAVTSQPETNLGYQGLVIVDRSGQELTSPDFVRAQNTALLARMRKKKDEVLVDQRGLSGQGGRVVAYDTSAAPGWVIAIDRSASSVFASARNTFVLQVTSIVVVALLALALIAWALRRVNRAADVERDRTQITTELSRSLADASTPADVSAALAASLSASFPSALAVVGLRLPDETMLSLTGVEGTFALTLDRKDPSLLEPAIAAFESGEAVFAGSESGVRRSFPGLHRGQAGRIRSAFATPIVTRNERLIGAVSLLWRSQRRLNANDRARIVSYVELASQAFTRTIRQEREHEAAITLQRSLLPDELPAEDGVALAVRYQAGSAGLEVGGDWYDAVRRPDGIFLVSVGDVAGRGIRAATLMAQLRNAFRAYAFEHSSPAEVVRRMTRHVPDEEMVTTVCLSLDPYSRDYRYSVAGHPPPLLVDDATAEVTRLDRGGAPPLGFVDAPGIVEASGTLPARATLIAYTDGLVERRGANIDDGIDLLASVLASVAAAEDDADEIASGVLRGVLQGSVGADDDAAFMVVRSHGVPARVAVELPADPSVLAPLRRRLDRWLMLRGVAENDRVDTILAVHEACINAIEHGYRLAGGTIRLRLDHTGEELSMQIEDEGDWKPPTPDPRRGRGTLIMQATMASARVEHDGHGTRVTLARLLGAGLRRR
jgi:serine phosphatase RsbU (regulator of sigma subunit)/anti-sigma regulatory factor (Ser/Thr protein kinase)